MAQPNSTRRALIGGSGIAAVAIAIPAVATLAPSARVGLFAQRLAEWNKANDRFLYAANVALMDDGPVNALCNAAAEAYRALLATPAPDAAAVLHKLKALNDWSDGCVIPDHEVRAIADEAAAILTIHGEA